MTAAPAPLDPILLWWLLIGAVVLVLPMALSLLMSTRRRRATQALVRMQRLAPAPTAKAAAVPLQMPRKVATPRRLPFVGDPDALCARAGVQMSGNAFLVLCAVATIGLGGIAGLAFGPLFGVALGPGLGLLAPVAVLRARHARRVATFAQQLPDALDLMMRGLRVGHPISATISNVGRTMADPIGAEFRTMATQISHGDYLADAFQDLAQRMQQEDMDYLAVSISIQHGTGGNLADMLSTLSRVIRQRIMLRRRVKALSSEGRISAMLLSSLPVIIYGATSILAPDYYGAVQDHPMFMPIGFVIVGLVLANFLVLRHLVNFQV
ncbi:type II secretion system F family protein [Puniceibacterium confluentis]|uniref:type II secretion system F family protein n=1 Tax=Puniceibacterium confluentis TaxID=1958944 RepID=UPI003561618A